MKKPLILAAAGEAAFGLALLADPPLVVRLLFDAEITGAGMVMSRVTGIALVALGVACWPGTPLIGMLTYGAAVTPYLAYVGFADGMRGILLWPAVVLHVDTDGTFGTVPHKSQGDGRRNRTCTDRSHSVPQGVC